MMNKRLNPIWAKHQDKETLKEFEEEEKPKKEIK
jgi:hypothetical protein